MVQEICNTADKRERDYQYSTKYLQLMAHIPNLNLFLDVNMPHLEELTNQLGKET